MAKSRGRKFAELLSPTNGVLPSGSIPTIPTGKLPTIPINKLAASTFSVNSESASLGQNVTIDSNDVTEHSSALYFTNARADARIAAHNLLPLAGGTMTGNLTLGDNVNVYFGASTDLRIYHDGTNSHIINSTGELRFTGSNFAFKSDSAKLYLGAGDDLQIYHDGSNSYITDAGTGDLRIKGANIEISTVGGNKYFQGASNTARLYHTNNEKLATTTTGISVTGAISLTEAIYSTDGSGQFEISGDSSSNTYFLSQGEIRFRPSGTTSNKFVIGTNGALTINGAYTLPTSDGTAGQVLKTDGSGNVTFGAATSGDITAVVAGTNLSGGATSGSATINLATNLSGLGTISSGAITSTGSSSFGDVFVSSNTPQLVLSDTGNGGGGGAEGKVLFRNTGGDAMGIGYTGDVTSDSDMIISTNAGGTYGGYLGLDSGGIADAKADIVLEPKTNVQIATGNLQLGDSQELRFGAGNDLKIYHNGSHSYIDEVGTGNLYIRNGTDNSIFARTNAEVILYYDGSSKLDTTATGVHVTGGVEADFFYSGLGTVSAPAIQVGDNNSGFYDSGANMVGVALNGVLEYDFQPTKLDMKGNELDNVGSIDINTTASQGVYITGTDSTANVGYSTVFIDHNASGSDALSTDRNHIALQIDMDSSATGGTTTDEHRLYGIHNSVKATGDSDLIYGIYSSAEAEQTSGQVSAMYGVWGQVVGDVTSGTLTNSYGVYGFNSVASASGTTTTGAYGGFFKTLLGAGQDTDLSTAVGCYGEVEIDTSGASTTLSSGYCFQAQFDNDSGGDVTINNGYLFYGNYAGTQPTTAYGVYIADTVRNYFAGSLTAGLGSTSAASYGFNGDLNTGMYSPANHQVALLANGSAELTVSNGLVTVNRLLTGLGSATSPAVSVGDTNTGFYDSGANTIGLSCDGTLQYNFTGTTLDMTANTITNNGGIAMNANTVLSIGTSPGDAFNTDASIRIGDTGNNYLQIITENDHQCGVLLGDEDDDFHGGMIYSNANNMLNLYANNAVQLTLSNNTAVFTASNIDIPSQIRHVGDTDTYIQFHAANQFRVVTGGGERLEVNQGTTTIAGTLNVRQAIDLADSDIFRLGSGDDAELFTNGSHLYLDLNSGIGNFYIRDGTTTRYTFNDNGNFTATGNITAYSDRRVKRDFEPIENALEKVSQLEGMTYIRTDMSDGNRRYAGLIAQDVEKVLPEAVHEEEDHKVLDYNGTIGLLVEAIKELKEEVASLKTQLKEK